MIKSLNIGKLNKKGGKMNKIKFLSLLMLFVMANEASAMGIFIRNIQDGQDLNTQEEQVQDQYLPQEEGEEEEGINSSIKVATMLRKLTYIYENISKELLEKIAQPNQEISRVQDLAYNIAYIKEILGYTNAIIDTVKLDQI